MNYKSRCIQAPATNETDTPVAIAAGFFVYVDPPEAQNSRSLENQAFVSPAMRRQSIRKLLPDIATMRLASQYWASEVDGFSIEHRSRDWSRTFRNCRERHLDIPKLNRLTSAP